MKQKLLKLTCLFFLSFNYLYADSIDFDESKRNSKMNYLRLSYQSVNSENLETIYEQILVDSYSYTEEDAMTKKTRRENGHIKDWASLKKKNFRLYVDIELIDINKFMKILNLSDEQIKALFGVVKAKEQVAQTQKNTKPLSFSVFYMTSLGEFNQKSAPGSVEFKQNSSVSLGLTTNYQINAKYGAQASLYYSQLNTASANKYLDNVSVDPEIGFNLYGTYKFADYGLESYGGLDFERFNTFNFDGLTDADQVTFDKNQIFFLTVGVQKNFKLYRRNFLAKFSYSHSVLSSRDIGYANTSDKQEFTGGKAMAYVMGDITKKIFAHVIFKMHFMDGPTDLTVNRLGLGFGYKF
ncbi:hypothetical protein M902_0850 [Bacteriovorax sp. BAL6_X]|uniref:hypothetical protein n=1 Tax=Bacteriovorax sp. BAL6_X TaxID=1201290 RepID=UPI000386C909|nr:hypothetical protein [Bacteriovorax sp. BAL6_X]EPZ49474.1 hypothetical protein M902_0850 [Bacteriovorax sp. BAL6_X]